MNRALSRLFRGIEALARDLEDSGVETTVTASISMGLRGLGIEAIPGDEEPQLGFTTSFEALDKVAMDVVNDPGRGGFLRALAGAWLEADAEAKEILRPAWIEIIDRHSLSENPVSPEKREAIRDFIAGALGRRTDV